MGKRKLRQIVNQQTGKVFTFKGKWSKSAVYTVCYGAGLEKLTKLLGSARRARVLRKVVYGNHKIAHTTTSFTIS